MSPITLLGLMTLLMLVLIAIEVPIAFSVAIAGGVGIVLLQDWNSLLYTVGTFPASRIASFSWSAIPLYILLGNLAAASGVAADAYELANKWFGRLRGGLVMATIVASGLIAATTGTGATSIAVMGKIAVPEMEKRGYDRSLSCGATASCGPLGMLIPPSTPFVVIGILAELSIGKLFIAGILPGILTVVVFMAMVWTRCKINPALAPLGESFPWKTRLRALGKAWGVVVIFVVVIGGLYTGIATATEVAALGCFVALIMALLAVFTKRATFNLIGFSVVDTIRVSAMVFAFIIGAGIFSLFITISGVIPDLLSNINSFGLSPYMILILVVVVYIILGLFFDPMSMVMVTVPIFFPLLVGGLGVDGVWFAVITVIMVEISALTPPVGLSLYMMKAVYPKATLGEITRGCMWFMVMNLVVVAILFMFPTIATWLPSLMYK